MPALPDLQHQRLRHLFSSAILELWKKETGSVTSVLIEGTVCVTVHGGRTTVVQLCDRFAGLVNGAGDCDGPPRGPPLDIGPHAGGYLSVTPATPRTPAKPRGRTTTTQAKDSNNNVRSAAPRDVAPAAAAAEVEEPGTGAGSTETDDDDECSLDVDDDVDDDDQTSMIVDDDEAAGDHGDSVSGRTRSFSPAV